MNTFLSRLLLDNNTDNNNNSNKKKGGTGCNSPTSTVVVVPPPDDDQNFLIVDDNARMPHYTLRLQAMARLLLEESERMSKERWVGSIGSSTSNLSTSSSTAVSPSFRGLLHDDSFNDSSNSILSNGGCQPICPKRRPSNPLECDSARAAHVAMRELLLDDEFSSDEDE